MTGKDGELYVTEDAVPPLCLGSPMPRGGRIDPVCLKLNEIDIFDSGWSPLPWCLF